MRKAFFIVLSVCIVASTSATIVPHSPSIDPDPKSVKTTLRAALIEWKNTSRKERKARVKLAKKDLKALKAARKNGKDADTNTILLAILAILLPPLAVYLHEGSANNRFLITLLLWLVGIAGFIFFSGWVMLAAIIYALIVVLS